MHYQSVLLFLSSLLFLRKITRYCFSKSVEVPCSYFVFVDCDVNNLDKQMPEEVFPCKAAGWNSSVVDTSVANEVGEYRIKIRCSRSRIRTCVLYEELLLTAANSVK